MKIGNSSVSVPQISSAKRISDIPPILVGVSIFVHLTLSEILPLMLTCKAWKNILYGEEFWEEMCVSRNKLSRELINIVSRWGISYRKWFQLLLTELLSGPASSFSATPNWALVIEEPPVGSDQIPCMLCVLALSYMLSNIMYVILLFLFVSFKAFVGVGPLPTVGVIFNGLFSLATR